MKQKIYILGVITAMIVFTGGEPLLRRDLEVCGKRLYERGFPWGIVSNGFHFTSKRLLTLLQAGLRAVTVSLDGLEDSHNWLRGNPQSFEKVLSAIKLLSDFPDLRYDVVTCINQKNFGELYKLKDLLLSNMLKEWRLFSIFPIGRARQHEQLQLNPVQFKQLFDFIRSKTKAKIFLHSCGSVYDHIPDLIEAGVEILSPVQFTAAKMDLARLKQDFGKLLFKPHGKFQPEIALVHNLGFGTLINQEPHENISYKTFEKGYFEGGLLINNLIRLQLFRYGLGVMYRYGPYAYPETIDNFAFKLTLQFSL